MATKVMLKNVRLSFPDLFQAKVPPNAAIGSKAKFRAQFIMEPGSEALKLVEAAVETEAKAKWTGKDKKGNPLYKSVIEAIPRDKMCLKEGNKNLTKSGDIYDGFEDMMYITASNTRQPGIFDKTRDPETNKPKKLVESDGKPYSGCYVNATIEIYAMDKQGIGKGVFATLSGVQFERDGDAFGGGNVSSADEYDSLAVDEGGDAALLS